MKKICLTAAPGPSVVINWNTSLEHSLLLFLQLLLLLFLLLAAWLFPSPPCLPWHLFLFVSASFLYNTFFSYSFRQPFLSCLPRVFLYWATVIVHFAAPCLPELPGRQKRVTQGSNMDREGETRVADEPTDNSHVATNCDIGGRRKMIVNNTIFFNAAAQSAAWLEKSQLKQCKWFFFILSTRIPS